MGILLLIIAAASLMLNAYQWQERRIERKDTEALIAESARLEDEVAKFKGLYENERLHSSWAVGRIKDQQAVIDQLKNGIWPKSKKARKEVGHD